MELLLSTAPLPPFAAQIAGAGGTLGDVPGHSKDKGWDQKQELGAHCAGVAGAAWAGSR